MMTYFLVFHLLDIQLKKRSFVEKIMRASLGSKNRKAWNKLFYLNDFNQTLSQTDAGNMKQPLKCLD